MDLTLMNHTGSLLEEISHNMSNQLHNGVGKKTNITQIETHKTHAHTYASLT